MTPQLLIVGHIVKDIQSGGWHPGGGALYAAAQAARLGVETAVVTACDRDIEPSELVPGVQWHVIRLDASIQFENTYAMGYRTQRVHGVDRVLKISDIPSEWKSAPAIFLTPVFHDVDERLPQELVNSGASLGIGVQGWLRRLEGDRVLPGLVESAPQWLHGNVVFLSEEDVTEPETVEQWCQRVPAVVLTRGRAGYTVWDAAGRHDIAAVPSCDLDPTGAGDIFATAYMVRYLETSDGLESARFGAAAAAVSVEGSGIDYIGDRAQIEARLRAVGVQN